MSQSSQSISYSRIAVTLGDPGGVGPEIVARALTGDLPPEGRYVVVGPAEPFRQALRALGAEGLAASLCVLQDPAAIDWEKGGLTALEPEGSGRWPAFELGRITAHGGDAAFQSLCLAIRLAMDGRADGICTAPLHKQGLHLAGHDFVGHTEILAHEAGVRRVVMLLQGGGLRVALVTTHAPIRQLADLITPTAVRETIEIVHRSLVQDWAFVRPRIAVTGLNPHAGDGGVLGDEEALVIRPVLEAVRANGIPVEGPLAADTVFHAMREGRYDCVVAMYHDQALGALKTVAFHEGVNITLGLPFIRTSADHGSAMDIAPRYCANPGSMRCALRDAVILAQSRQSILREPMSHD